MVMKITLTVNKLPVDHVQVSLRPQAEVFVEVASHGLRTTPWGDHHVVHCHVLEDYLRVR